MSEQLDILGGGLPVNELLTPTQAKLARLVVDLVKPSENYSEEALADRSTSFSQSYEITDSDQLVDGVTAYVDTDEDIRSFWLNFNFEGQMVAALLLKAYSHESNENGTPYYKSVQLKNQELFEIEEDVSDEYIERKIKAVERLSALGLLKPVVES